MFGSFNLNCKSRNEKKKKKKHSDFHLTQQEVAGRGGDEKKKIDGEKIHARGEEMPQGASTDFHP